jgi:hypothetical protein
MVYTRHRGRVERSTRDGSFTDAPDFATSRQCAPELRFMHQGIDHAERLRRLRIGLVKYADDGVLQWTAILNMGFDEGGFEPSQYAARTAE